MKKQVTIYTDGACSGNPGPGGWGCVLMYNQHKKESSGGAEDTTNNRMEITAALEALKLLKEPCQVDLYTDSAYLCNALEKKWLETWSRNGWKTASKSNVENQDLWTELLIQLQRHEVKFHKVKELTKELAEMENTIYRLAFTIKKTQKRANALRNIVIPGYESTIALITEALEEKEREEFSRLKVIKAKKNA